MEKGEHIYPVGTWITVSRNIPLPDDRSWHGDALRVEAFNYPFYAVSRLRPTGDMDFTFSLDVRRFELLQLAMPYVVAMGLKKSS